MKTYRVGIYKFSEEELAGLNPYNDGNGIPLSGNEQISTAWAVAAYKYRLSLLSEKDKLVFVHVKD